MPTNPTWEETEDISAPTWDDTVAEEDVIRQGVEAPISAMDQAMRTLALGAEGTDFARRKRALEEQAAVAREEGRIGRFGEKLLGTVEGATGIVAQMDPVSIAQQVLNPQHRTVLPPGITPGEFVEERIIGMPPAAPGSVREGVNRFISETATGLSDPVIVGAIAAGKIPGLPGPVKVIPPRLFQVDMGGASGEAIKQAYEAETPGDVAKAVLNTAMTVATPFGIERHMQPPARVAVPDFPGLDFKRRGAPSPRPEPPPPGPARVTPEEAKRARQEMTQQATLSFTPKDAPKPPKPTVPEGPLEPEAPPVPPPQPVEIATWQDAVGELRKRGKGTETREEIKALLPELQRLSNEAARDLALEAWGAEWRPGGKEKPPIGERKPREAQRQEVAEAPVLDTQRGTPPQPAKLTPEQEKATIIADRIKAGLKDEDMQVIVQKDPDFPKGNYVQVDDVTPGLNNPFSSNPETLRTAGLDVPTTEQLMRLPQGRYTLAQAKQLLAQGEGKPSTAPAAKAPEVPDAAADYARYQELTQQNRQAFMSGDAGKLAEIGKEIEAIKNRHGGNPPPKPGEAERAAAPIRTAEEMAKEREALKTAETKQPKPATFYGEPVKGKRMYNLAEDIKDPQTGEVLHPAGSSVMETTLDKYGVPYEKPAAAPVAAPEAAKPTSQAGGELKAIESLLEETGETRADKLTRARRLLAEKQEIMDNAEKEGVDDWDLLEAQIERLRGIVNTLERGAIQSAKSAQAPSKPAQPSETLGPAEGTPEYEALSMGAKGALHEFEINQRTIDTGLLSTGQKARRQYIEDLRARQAQVRENFARESAPKAEPVTEQASPPADVRKQWEDLGRQIAELEAQLGEEGLNPGAPLTGEQHAIKRAISAIELQRANLGGEIGLARMREQTAPFRGQKEPPATVRIPGKVLSAQKKTLLQMVDDALKKPQAGPKAVFEVPGDGTFTVENTPENLRKFRDIVRKEFPSTATEGTGIPGTASGKARKPATVSDPDPQEIPEIIASFLSDDPTRYILRFSYADGTQVIATDGRQLIRVVSDKAPGKPDAPVYFDAEGKQVEAPQGRYPDYSRIHPTDPELAIGGADTGQLFHIARQAQVFRNAIQPDKDRRTGGLELFINKDRSLGGRMELTGETFEHNVQDGAIGLGAFNPDYILDAVNAARRLGNEKVDLLVDGNTGPLVVRGKNSESLVMPMRLGEKTEIRDTRGLGRVAGRAEHAGLPKGLGPLEPVEMARSAGVPNTGNKQRLTVRADGVVELSTEGAMSYAWRRRGRGQTEEPTWTTIFEIKREDLIAGDAAERGRLFREALEKAGEKPSGKRINDIEHAFKEIEQERAKAVKEAQKRASKKEPEIVGMGGAVPGEFRGGGSPTAMKYKLIDEERVKRGLEPLTKPESVSDQKTMDRAMAEMDKNPEAGRILTEQLIKNARVIEDWENHLLLLEKIDIRNELYRAMRDAREAYEDGKQFPERLADMRAAEARALHWSEQLDKIEQASRVSGSARGRALRALQVMANEDYSLEALTFRAKIKKGSDLTADERKKLIEVAEEHRQRAEALDAKLKEAEKARDAAEAERIKAKAEADAAKAQAGPKASPYVIELVEKVVRTLDNRADAARARLRARTTRFSSAMGAVDPTILVDLAEIGASHIAHLGLNLAKWTDAMVKDVGDWAKPHLDEVWKRSQESLNAAVKVASPAKVAKQVAKGIAKAAKPAGVDLVETVQKIKNRLTKDPRADLSYLARKIARHFVEQGTKDREQLIDQVHGVLQSIIPDMGRREAMDILSGYGSFTRLPKDAVSVTLRDLQGQMQQIAKLEDMLAGEAPLRTGKEQRSPSDIERELQQQVYEQKKRGGYQVTDPETQLRTALDAVKKRLENQIRDLEVQIDRREKIVKERTPIREDNETVKLRIRRDELKAQFEEVFPREPISEVERLQRWKERTAERMEELRDILANEKSRPGRRPPVELDKEARRMRFDLHQLERQIRDRERMLELKARSPLMKLVGGGAEALNLSRAFLTAFDLSAPLRQGLILSVTQPRAAVHAASNMFKALSSEKRAFEIAQSIRDRENAPLYEAAKLYLSEHGGRLNAMEEANMSRLADKIPGIRQSQRAYTAYLNTLRADAFDIMTRGLTADGKGNLAELQAIANFINVATGRGKIPFTEGGAGLSTVFFAPRYVASRFQFLVGQPFFKALAKRDSRAAAKLIAWEYGKFLGAVSVFYALAQFAGAEVETDADSSDFGKVKIGPTRIDPMAGLLQTAVLLHRTASGEIKSTKTGRTTPTVGKVPYGKSDYWDVLSNFMRGKLSPALGNAISLRLGEDPAGNEFGLGEFTKQSIIPIGWQDIIEATKAQGLPAGAALAPLAIFGVGLMTHEPEEKRLRL